MEQKWNRNGTEMRGNGTEMRGNGAEMRGMEWKWSRNAWKWSGNARKYVEWSRIGAELRGNGAENKKIKNKTTRTCTFRPRPRIKPHNRPQPSIIITQTTKSHHPSHPQSSRNQAPKGALRPFYRRARCPSEPPRGRTASRI